MFTRYPRKALWVGTASVALLAAARFYGPPRAEAPATLQASMPIATPAGITLQLRASDVKVRVATAAELVIADARGMSLYTYDKDTSRNASCVDGCAVSWQAAIAAGTSRPDGDWSLLDRKDGTRQWLYRGAPLYAFAEDKAIGEAAGDGAGGGAWHVAVFRPGADIAMPDGVAVREIADAGGVGLVDASGLTLYLFDGATPANPICSSGDCASRWIPLEAPGIANPAGHFSTIARDDGITQWAYQGKPLYKFNADQQPGDVNGAGVDPRFRVALTLRFFMPAGVTIRRHIELGNILATGHGATLYQRDRVTMQELHPFRVDHGSPALGRALGTATCDALCAKTWPPLAAPEDAISSGYWDVVSRADGTRQWSYKGFALYTYAADQPGDIGGNGIYTLAQVGGSDIDPNLFVGGAASGLGVSALFWHAVVP
jgi:predicted lipoprotein with Yx(FWY)xxD motif